MKPTCYANTNTYKYNFLNMCGSPAYAGQAIIPLKSKLYYDETHMIASKSQTQNEYNSFKSCVVPSDLKQINYILMKKN